MPFPLAEFVRDHNNVLAAVIVESTGNVAWGRDAADQIGASFVSTNWFSELGYGAMEGRMFTDSLDTTSDVPSVVLGYTFWHNRLGAVPNLVGSIAYIDRKPVRIVGIAPVAVLPGKTPEFHSHPAVSIYPESAPCAIAGSAARHGWLERASG